MSLHPTAVFKSERCSEPHWDIPNLHVVNVGLAVENFALCGKVDRSHFSAPIFDLPLQGAFVADTSPLSVFAG